MTPKLSWLGLLVAVLAGMAFAEYNPTGDALFLYTYNNASLRRENSVTGSGVGDAIQGGFSSPAWVAGRLGGEDIAARFNFDHHEVAAVAALNTPNWGLTFWFKNNDTTAVGTIISRTPERPGTITSSHGWRVIQDCPNHEFRIGYVGQLGHLQYNSVAWAPDREWHLFCMNVRYSSPAYSYVDVYIDGVLMDTFTHYMAITLGENTYYPQLASGRNIFIGAADTLVDGPDVIAIHWMDITLDNVGMYSSLLTTEVIDTLFKGGWMPDPDPEANGQFTIPCLIHNVLYDPPGDQSYSYMMQDSTYSTSMSNTWTFGNGSTTTAGFEAGFSYFGLFEVNASTTVSQGITNTVTGQSRSTYELTKNSSIASRPDEDPLYIGPGAGDIIVAQQASFGWRLWKKLKDAATPPITDESFDYRLAYWPLADQPEDTLAEYTVDGFIAKYAAFPDLVDTIVSQLAIDPATRRVRPELVSSGALTGSTPFSWSATDRSESRTATLTTSFSYGIDVELTTSLSVGAKIGPVSGSRDATMSVGMGAETSVGVTFSQTCGYRWYDTEGWDRFGITQYLDTRTGTYVFDIDKDNSYASFPFEDNHALRAVDWDVTVTVDSATGPAGVAVLCTVSVSNTTPDIVGLPDSFEVDASITSYDHQGNLPTNKAWIARGESRDFVVSLSAPVEGMFDAEVQFRLLRPSSLVEIVGDQKTVTVTGVFTTPDRGIYVEVARPTVLVDPSVTAPLARNFVVTMNNLSAQSETIQYGLSDLSPNTSFNHTSISNPVEAAGERTATVTLTGDPLEFPHTASFWAQLEGFPETRQAVNLTIDTTGLIIVGLPAEGALLIPDEDVTISWVVSGRVSVSGVDIEYSTGSGWTSIADGIENTGSYQWTVPMALAGDTIEIRVADTSSADQVRAGSVEDVAVEEDLGVFARRTLGLNETRFVARNGLLRVQFGDQAIGRMQLFSPTGRLAHTAAVENGIAVVESNELHAGQTLLAVWRTGRGVRKVKRLVMP